MDNIERLMKVLKDVREELSKTRKGFHVQKVKAPNISHLDGEDSNPKNHASYKVTHDGKHVGTYTIHKPTGNWWGEQNTRIGEHHDAAHEAAQKFHAHLHSLSKEEFSKEQNMSYGAAPNMIKDEAEKADVIKPDKGFGKITIKDPTPKPPANPEKPYGKVILKEELHCSENGQWKLLEKDAKNPALAPKERKVKELQGKIDAGMYKPDASKIADAMLKPKK